VAIGAALLVMTATATARTAAVAGASIAANANPMDIVLDTLMRPAAATTGAAPAAGTSTEAAPETAPATAAAEGAASEATRAEMGRILTRAAADGELSAPDRSYLASVVAQRLGLPQAEAERRVDEAFNAARAAVDKARRGTALMGFVTAAALILSLGAAWWAAMRGGHHRDNAVPPRFAVGSYRRSRPASG
jgi:hypothetical protein